MIPDNWYPPILSGLFLLASVILNLWGAMRLKQRQDSADVTTARITDGGKLREELWQRVYTLETRLDTQQKAHDDEREKDHLEIDMLKGKLAELTQTNRTMERELTQTRDDLTKAQGQITALNNQIAALMTQLSHKT